MKKKIILTALTLALFVSAIGVRADQSVTLAWNPSPSTGVAGYILRYGSDGTNYGNPVDTGINTVWTVTGLQAGTNYFVVSAYDANHNESPPSNSVKYVTPGNAQSVVTNAALIVTPPVTIPPATPSMTPIGTSKTVSLDIPVISGHIYQIQASTDLKAWTTIWQTTVTNDSVIRFTDPDSTDFKMRFYRTASY